MGQLSPTIKLYHDESDITRLYFSELMSACCHGHSDDMLMQSRCKADFCTFSQFVPMQMSLVEHVLVKAGDHMIIKIIKIHSKQGTEPNFITLLSVVWTCPLQTQERNLNHSILCLSLQKTSKTTGELGRSKRQRSLVKDKILQSVLKGTRQGCRDPPLPLKRSESEHGK